MEKWKLAYNILVEGLLKISAVGSWPTVKWKLACDILVDC